MQTRNRFLETSARLSSRSGRFSSAKFLSGCSTPDTSTPATVDPDTFVLDILEFFFEERLSPAQLNDHLKRVAAEALSEANSASENLDFVPRPPGFPPTVTWLVGQAVQIAYRKAKRDGKIYEIVRIRVKSVLRSEYELAKMNVDGALSYRSKSTSRQSPATMSINSLYLSEEGKRFMSQFPASTMGAEDISLVENTVNNSTSMVALNQKQFDALVSFCRSITTGKFLSSTLLSVLNTPFPSDTDRNIKIAEEIRKWKLIDGADDPDSISRRGAEADLFLSGSYSGASSVFRSYEAFALAKSSTRVSKAQTPAVAVASVGVGFQILKGFIDNRGDITYDLAKMDGQKCPSDDEAKYKNKASYQDQVFTVTKETTGIGGINDMSADFEVHFKYNGYAVGYVLMNYARGQDAIGWGLDVKADMMADPNDYQRSDGDRMSAIQLTFTYRFSTSVPFRDDDVWVGNYKIFGDGHVEQNGRWTSAP